MTVNKQVTNRPNKLADKPSAMHTFPMKPLIIAHRGNNAIYPENALNGLRSSFESGCLAVEFDIQLSGDQTPVIIHDTNALRTAGVRQSVFAMNREMLPDISVHEPKRFGDKHFPTPLASLEAFMPLLKEFPDAHAYIELKEESMRRWSRQAMLEQVLPIIEPFAKQCTLISFDLPILEMALQQSQLPVGWVLYHYHALSEAEANRVKPQYLIVNHRKLPARGQPWQGPWQWMIYGVDTPAMALDYFARGIKYIETDNLPLLFQDERLKP